MPTETSLNQILAIRGKENVAFLMSVYKFETTRKQKNSSILFLPDYILLAAMCVERYC